MAMLHEVQGNSIKGERVGGGAWDYASVFNVSLSPFLIASIH